DRYQPEGASEAPPRGVSIDDCTEVSRFLEPLLEEQEVVPGSYDLEVSSPGLDRRLRLREDFEAAVGQQVKLKLRQPLPNGGSGVTGDLVRVESDEVVLNVSKHEVSIPLNNIVRATRIWRFQ